MKTLPERVTEISLSCVTVKSWAGGEQPSTETGGSKDVKRTWFPCLILGILQSFLVCWRCWSKEKKEMTGRQLKFHLLFSPIESTSDRLSPPVYSTGIFCSSPLDPSTVSWRLATKSIEVFKNRLKPIIFFPNPLLETMKNSEKEKTLVSMFPNIFQYISTEKSPKRGCLSAMAELSLQAEAAKHLSHALQAPASSHLEDPFSSRFFVAFFHSEDTDERR